jgi:hypothetical protein
LQVVRQVLDYAFAPAVLLLALGNELAQVLLELDLLLIDLPQGLVLGFANALFHGSEQLVVVGSGRIHGWKIRLALESIMTRF